MCLSYALLSQALAVRFGRRQTRSRASADNGPTSADPSAPVAGWRGISLVAARASACFRRPSDESQRENNKLHANFRGVKLAPLSVLSLLPPPADSSGELGPANKIDASQLRAQRNRAAELMFASPQMKAKEGSGEPTQLTRATSREIGRIGHKLRARVCCQS